MFQVGDKVRIKNSNLLMFSTPLYQQHCGEETEIVKVDIAGKENYYDGLYYVASNPRIWYGSELEPIEDFSLTEKEVLNCFGR